MRHGKVLAVVSAVLVGCLGWLPAALADDVNPPPYEGLPNSVVLFTEDQGSGLEITGFDVFPGPFPLTDADCGNGPGEPCLEIIPIVGATEFNFGVPNFVDPLPVKLLRIQVTYFGPDPLVSTVLGFDPICPNPTLGFGICPGVPLTHVVDTPDTQGASYFFEDWLILPNPDFDFIQITAPTGTSVVQVVIDTISIPIPLPASLLLYGGGFASLLGYGWWRRRRGSSVPEG